MEIDVWPFRQEGVQMYQGVLNADELLAVARVDEWHEADGEERGYQRKLSPTRTGDVARYLTKDKCPLLPTSILLSHRGKLNVLGRTEGGFARVELPEGETLWVVDGQHRLEGLRKAIDEFGQERLKDYPLPIVIVEFADESREADQFRIINETMKKVSTDLARRLLTNMRARADSGQRRAIRDQYFGRTWEMNAVDIVKILRTNDDSPWKGRIASPQERKQKGQIKELSFETSLKPILTFSPYSSPAYSAERLAGMLMAYWSAWQQLVPEAFDDPDDYVLLKTPGLFSLHTVARHVFEILRVNSIMNPTASDFHAILRDLGEYADAYYWASDNSRGAALAGSMKGFALLAEEIVEALQQAGHSV